MNIIKNLTSLHLFFGILLAPLLIIYFSEAINDKSTSLNSAIYCGSVLCIYLLILISKKPKLFFDGASRMGISITSIKFILISNIFLLLGISLSYILGDLGYSIGVFSILIALIIFYYCIAREVLNKDV